MANAFSVQMDQKFWKDPDTFRPERFLDETRMIIESEYVLPFGLGMITDIINLTWLNLAAYSFFPTLNI